MSTSNWLRKSSLSVALLIAVLGAFGALFGYGLWTQTKSQLASDHRRHDYTVGTHYPKYDACVDLIGKDKTNCIAKAQNENRENERQERDLVAQETTATWTLVMSGAAILGVMLSVLGVLLVWVTFRETRKTNEIARLGGRPWVEFSIFEVADFQYPVSDHKDAWFGMKPEFWLKNWGQSPAIDISFDCISFVGMRGNFDAMIAMLREKTIGKDFGTGLAIFPGDEARDQPVFLNSEMLRTDPMENRRVGFLWVVVGVSYSDSHGGKYGTYKLYRVPIHLCGGSPEIVGSRLIADQTLKRYF